MTEPALEAPKPCHLGAVFALAIESGCFEDMLEGMVAIRGNRFTVREGGLHGRRVVVVLSGAGESAARDASEVLIDGHHPDCVISAGFAGGLSADLPRGAILIADRALHPDGDELPLEWPRAVEALAANQLAGQEFHRGPLLTLDRIVRSPDERQALYRRHRRWQPTWRRSPWRRSAGGGKSRSWRSASLAIPWANNCHTKSSTCCRKKARRGGWGP